MNLSLIVVVLSLSHVRLFATPWTAARQSISSMSYMEDAKLLRPPLSPRVYSNSCPLSL